MSRSFKQERTTRKNTPQKAPRLTQGAIMALVVETHGVEYCDGSDGLPEAYLYDEVLEGTDVYNGFDEYYPEPEVDNPWPDDMDDYFDYGELK